MPRIIKVAKDPKENQKGWDDFDNPFNEYSALRIIHADTQKSNNGSGVESKEIYHFYVNVDNIYLKSEQKGQKGSREFELIKAKIIYGLVLLGLSLINYNTQNNNEKKDLDDYPLDVKIEDFTKAVAPVLIPMINQLGGMNLEEQPNEERG